jgi:flagellar P-ring protein precursor FlgI
MGTGIKKHAIARLKLAHRLVVRARSRHRLAAGISEPLVPRAEPATAIVDRRKARQAPALARPRLRFRGPALARLVSWALLICGLALSRDAPAARLKDIADIQGVRDNDLFGYGLGGTGDSDQVLFTTQSLGGLLGRLGIRVSASDIHVRNVAAVMVTARLSPYTRAGTHLDVSVSSIGNARSLAGGVLLITPLTGADGQVHAVAQGAVQVGGYSVSAFGSSMDKNNAASGRIPAGAIVELSVSPNLAGGPLVLDLRHPDFTNATRIAAAIGEAVEGAKARALDSASVEITPPAGQDLVGVIAKLEAVVVETDQRAKVVISERTGTVVAGENVRIHPVAVAHGGMKVAIAASPVVSPRLGTLLGRQATIAVEEGAAKAVSVPAAGTVDEIVKGLNMLGANPRDLVAILQAIEAAGALDGDLEVI